MDIRAVAPFALLMLAACGQQKAAEPAVPEAEALVETIETVAVPAAAETVVTDNPTVDADDPVLWRDPADPKRALWIGTDKSKGLYVHDLSGKVLQFFADGPMNNVDQRSFTVGGKPMVLVTAADRGQYGVRAWLLDPATLKLSRWGHMPTEAAFGEPYGFCMGQFGGETFAIANNKAGAVHAYAVTEGKGGKPAMTLRAQC